MAVVYSGNWTEFNDKTEIKLGLLDHNQTPQKFIDQIRIAVGQLTGRRGLSM